MISLNEFKNGLAQIINAIPNNSDTFELRNGFINLLSDVQMQPVMSQSTLITGSEILEDNLSYDSDSWEKWEHDIVHIWQSNIMMNDTDKTMNQNEVNKITISLPARTKLLSHNICGCGHCKRVFRSKEVLNWTKGAQYGVCPYCFVDCLVSLDMLHLIPSIHDERYA